MKRVRLEEVLTKRVTIEEKEILFSYPKGYTTQFVLASKYGYSHVVLDRKYKQLITCLKRQLLAGEFAKYKQLVGVS